MEYKINQGRGRNSDTSQPGEIRELNNKLRLNVYGNHTFDLSYSVL